jgi:hypothetical protein
MRALEAGGVEFLEGEPPRLKTVAVKRATWEPPPSL